MQDPHKSFDPFALLLGPESEKEKMKRISKMLKQTVASEVRQRQTKIIEDTRHIEKKKKKKGKIVRINERWELEAPSRRNPNGISVNIKRTIFVPPKDSELSARERLERRCGALSSEKRRERPRMSTHSETK